MDYKICSALSHDLFCVSLHPLIQKLFRVQKHHQGGNRILPAPHLTITLTSRITSTINSQSPVVRLHRLIERHGTDKFGGTVAHKTYQVVDPLDSLWAFTGNSSSFRRPLNYNFN